ncbi:MAG: ribulose-phosphate 3-epimerase [Candidatus Campbellbacteria bacterium]
MIEVVPAIIPDTYEDITAKAGLVRSSVSRVQLDVADGTYAPSKTWPYNGDDGHMQRLASEDEGLPLWDEINYEVDLLIDEPEKEIDTWIRVGVAAAVVHIESTKAHGDIFKKLKDADIEVGWAITPSTPNEVLFSILEAHGVPDFVQCMGSDDIGYHGVSLDERVYEKIEEIRARYPELPIAVDIGVSEETAPQLVDAGATKLVSGSAIFGSENIKATIERLKNL